MNRGRVTGPPTEHEDITNRPSNDADAWTVPDDRKLNPWDLLNERGPGEDGTRGTISGPTLECSVGDSLVVHFTEVSRVSTRKYGTSQPRELIMQHTLHGVGVRIDGRSYLGDTPTIVAGPTTQSRTFGS